MINISNLSKSFGKNTVLTQVNLKIGEGECHSLIGKNGSGKSTLINLMIDLIEPDTGGITFWGEQLNTPDSPVKAKVGVLPEFNPLIEEFSVHDYLEYIGVIYGLEKGLIKQRTAYLIDYFYEEDPGKKKPMSQFSKGMKMKAGVCAALIHKPKFLILDEPFDGMDVFSSNGLVAFLNEYRSLGNSILISSHDMLFMEKIATHLSLIKETEVLNFTAEEFRREGTTFEQHVSEVLGYNLKEIKEFI